MKTHLPLTLALSIVLCAQASAAGVQRTGPQRNAPVRATPQVRLDRPMGGVKLGAPALSLPVSKVAGVTAGAVSRPAASAVSRQQQSVGGMAQTVSSRIEAMKAPSVGSEQLSQANGEIAEILTGEKGIRGSAVSSAVSGKSGSRRSTLHSRKAGPRSAPYFKGYVRERVADPRDLYDRARAEAVKVVKSLHRSAEQLSFGQATGVMPVVSGRGLEFTFYLQERGGSARPITVSFSRGYGTAPGWFESKAYAGPAMAVPYGLFPKLDQGFTKGLVDSPESALETARRTVKSLDSRVSFSLRWEKDAQTGDTDLWYRFYDDKGSEVVVNAARTGKVRAVKKAEPAGQSLWSRLASVFGGLGGSAAVAVASLLAASPALAASAGHPVAKVAVGGGIGVLVGLIGGGLIGFRKGSEGVGGDIAQVMTAFFGALIGALIGAVVCGAAGALLGAAL